MTRDEFQIYIEHIAGLMRLGHWTIKVDSKLPKNEGAWASVVCWDGRFGATIYLSDGILAETPEDQRYVAVHELAHCYFAQSDKIAEADMSSTRSDAWRLAMEYGIDSLAQVIASRMPLPNEVLHGST